MSRKPTTKPWTEAHVNQAKAALYRLAAEASAKGNVCAARLFAGRATLACVTWTETEFALELGRFSLSEVEVAKILRAVRARGEGREVVTVEKRWLVKWMFSSIDEPRFMFADGTFGRRSERGSEEPLRLQQRTDAKKARTFHAAGLTGVVSLVPVTLTRRRYLPAAKGGL